jgi:hypothetical protein
MATVASGRPVKDRLGSIVPILGWIRTYDTSTLLRSDVLAGLTVAAFSVPESMTYAGPVNLHTALGARGTTLRLAEAIGQVRDAVRAAGLENTIG